MDSAAATTGFIFRAPKDRENPYAMIRRDTLQDRSLTWEARGILAYLLSQSDTWRVQATDLCQNCGETVVYRVLNELIEHGYIERTSERNEKGHVKAWGYAVHEEPLLPENPKVGKPKNRETLNLGFRGLNNKQESDSNKKQESERATKPKPKTNSKTAPKATPTVKPSETKAKSRAKKTPLELALEGMQPYKAVVHALAVACKAGYDATMSTPENSLSVKELESYTAAAADFVRLGGNVDAIPAIYEYVDDCNPDRSWTIAPTSIVKNLSGWKALDEVARPEPAATEQRVSTTGRKPLTAEERQQMLQELRQDASNPFTRLRPTG